MCFFGFFYLHIQVPTNDSPTTSTPQNNLRKRHRGFAALALLTAEEIENLGDGSKELYANSTLGICHVAATTVTHSIMHTVIRCRSN